MPAFHGRAPGMKKTKARMSLQCKEPQYPVLPHVLHVHLLPHIIKRKHVRMPALYVLSPRIKKINLSVFSTCTSWHARSHIASRKCSHAHIGGGGGRGSKQNNIMPVPGDFQVFMPTFYGNRNAFFVFFNNSASCPMWIPSTC